MPIFGRFLYRPLPLLALIVGTVAIGLAVAAEESVVGPKEFEFFEAHVRPLLVKNCYQCHSKSDAKGGLVLDTREGIRKGGDSGAAIVPHDPDKSRLIEAVRYTNPDLQMPPKNRLSAVEIETLEKWVAMGAPDPRNDVEADSGPAPTGMSIEAGREFWSFRPISSPEVPYVQQQEWVQNPIDAFVLAKLESKNLLPALRADKRTLIRRVTFDLIGLPPTTQEIQAFLDDESTNAFQSVVERLLKSPGYGVRWGRHWLDVVRYADSNGLDENLAFGNAWRYRDYVVDSFNKDKPFQRFLIEQIAGDLLPEANQETRTATGFLVLGAKVLAEPDREKLVMDTIDEQIDTIGKAFLGITLGCVRCHDHKFDPVKQPEYYSLAAIFKSTRTFADSGIGAIKYWNEYSLATEEDLAQLKEIDQQIAEKKSAVTAFNDAARVRLQKESRAKAADYLMAASRFSHGSSLAQVEAIALPLGLHPRILHHCRLHLHYHQDDPFFRRWHELAIIRDVVGIGQHYAPLFEAAEREFAAAQAKNALATVLTDEHLEFARAALYDASGFLAIPPKPEFAFDEQTLREYYRLADESRTFESSAIDSPSVMGVADGAIHTKIPIQIRGSHLNPGAEVARDFPAVMRPTNSTTVLPSDQSGRRELAEWMASETHPLTARVYVNRIWRWHFGQGIVPSTENFGVLGARPSHPELLDWLAHRLIESGWSTHALHRLILFSNTYQMASAHRDEQTASTIDPENSLRWKCGIQRLDAEQVRDAILAVSGRLDESIGGKTVPLRNRQFVFDHTSIDHTNYDSLRRAIYLPVIRNNIYSLFEQFDFPDPTMPTGHRNSTVVAPQTLIMMNSELIMDSAQAFSGELMKQSADDVSRAGVVYERALGRLPIGHEVQRILEFIDGFVSRNQSDASLEIERGTSNRDDSTIRKQAWSMVCQSLMASNEFLFLR